MFFFKTNSYIIITSPATFFGSIPTQAPAMDLLKLNTLRGITTAFLTLNKYEEHPLVFIWDPPPPPGGGSNTAYTYVSDCAMT